MDVRAVQTFVAVADELHFGRAARRLHAAQSTVSASIAAFERELGAPLLHRSTRSVRLTPTGEAVLTEARRLLADADRLRAAAAASTAGLRGTVRLGVFVAMDALDLPERLAAFRRERPLVEVRVTTSPSGSTGLLADLRAGRIDLALVALPVAELAGLALQPLDSTPFVALLPSDHRLARARAVSLAELADEPWVDAPPGFANRVLLDRAFASTGRTRSVTTEVPDVPSIRSYVAAGLGVGAVPASIVPEHPRTVRIPLVEPLRWELQLASPLAPSPAVAALAERLSA